jgi:hypothetical protein
VLGDEYIRGAAAVARNMGFETVLDDNPPTFPAAFPMSQIALYAGWYEGNVCGPLARPEVEFMPGAFAYHLHSFSASTLRTTDRFWVGPLLAKGASATVGYVEEPYLHFTSDLEVLLRNLLEGGASFGEAAWSAERAVSWQTTVLGDPLYRPFALPLPVRHQQLEQQHSRLIEWSHLLVVNRNLVHAAPVEEAINYLNQEPFTQASAILTEKLGDLRQQQTNTTEAILAYDQALDRHPTPQQKLRLLLTIATLQTSAGQDRPAVLTWQRLLKECPDYPNPVEIHRKLLVLAGRLKDQKLTSECEAEITRLTPPPTNSSAPPGQAQAPQKK